MIKLLLHVDEQKKKKNNSTGVGNRQVAATNIYYCCCWDNAITHKHTVAYIRMHSASNCLL